MKNGKLHEIEVVSLLSQRATGSEIVKRPLGERWETKVVRRQRKKARK